MTEDVRNDTDLDQDSASDRRALLAKYRAERGPIAKYLAGHPVGPDGYFAHMRRWRDDGQLDRLELSR